MNSDEGRTPGLSEAPGFRAIPFRLECLNAPVAEAEITDALTTRKKYELESWQNPYMTDIIRAFRLVEGAGAYVEVGTRDKGNLAWVASKLVPEALMIDVDIDRFDSSEALLRQEIGDLEYHRITGDSIAPATVAQVRRALGNRLADAIFCDSSHLFSHTLAEFESYFPLVRPGGVLMFHDCFWEGNSTHKGKAQAMAAIDRFVPVYSVFMEEPVTRFIPRPEKTDVWGGVSIITKPH